ncbi:unnamed protein product [marine sediment metagenome]|uniref:Uncharacterized protein n=1 Tax=marine sediment metagenome TaxID=412755 RepID=X1DAC2_9ZZZZ
MPKEINPSGAYSGNQIAWFLILQELVGLEVVQHPHQEQVRVLRGREDPISIETAKLYEKLATSLEAELALPEQPRRGAALGEHVGVPREVMPGEATEGLEGLGRV